MDPELVPRLVQKRWNGHKGSYCWASIRNNQTDTCSRRMLPRSPRPVSRFCITESRLSCVRNITQGTNAAVWSQSTPARHCSLSVWVGINRSSAAKQLGVTLSQDISLSSPQPPFFQLSGALSSDVTHLSGDEEPVIIVINRRNPKLQGQAARSSFWGFTNRLRVQCFPSDSQKWNNCRLIVAIMIRTQIRARIMFTDLRSHGSGLPFAVRPDLFIISCGQHRTPCVINGLQRTIVSCRRSAVPFALLMTRS